MRERTLYAAILGALLVLTALSYGAAKLSLPGFVAPVVALSIASVKAALVVWHYMHMKSARVSARIAFATTIAFIALLCLGLAADVAAR